MTTLSGQSARICVTFIVAFLVCGCQSTTQHLPFTISQFTALHASSGTAEQFAIPDEKTIFALPPAAKKFVDDALRGQDANRDKMHALAYHITAQNTLNMQYNAVANTVAADTFYRAHANCLSLTIMSYAMAKYAGFNASFQEVHIPEYWTVQEGQTLLNGHVNVQIIEKQNVARPKLFGSVLTIDFDPHPQKQRFTKSELAKPQVIASFYNNRAGQALVDKDIPLAKAYLLAALKVAPHEYQIWNNVGLLMRREGHYQQALLAYQNALSLAPEVLTVHENLAILQQHMGQHEQAQRTLRWIQTQRIKNPYYHLMLARQALANNAYATALQHIQAGLRIAPNLKELLHFQRHTISLAKLT
jgi:tetratricopeptide (TPR) repeat protein